ncbi:hypothetical protein [Cutibacterium avidum]|uniref:Uncharacterized protein n=1 Tax=Cutibacterium avidum ATCC 25577 TaxID=997355 RepID=G4CWQ4_9ACTN|nr:hypothetical protein [Cutibacterium avidum]EGY78114.1 hypothetical protein HMPREF9153_0961 [Cutibacterium avidum ATCC 25577]MBS6261526.1 hypothetical protein [Propionibacterium sp.]MCG7371045.1 hypothetical protein [Cutibacterium avidum]MCO6668002.1 hypothetical protein [Cutibacterium avidum]MCO6683841.1 hypothetical protein [Cutibacterium avidum]
MNSVDNQSNTKAAEAQFDRVLDYVEESIPLSSSTADSERFRESDRGHGPSG